MSISERIKKKFNLKGTTKPPDKPAPPPKPPKPPKPSPRLKTRLPVGSKLYLEMVGAETWAGRLEIPDCPVFTASHTSQTMLCYRLDELFRDYLEKQQSS